MRATWWLCTATILLGASAARAAPADTTPRPVIIDTDVGDDIDDAFALAVALQDPRLNVIGITTINVASGGAGGESRDAGSVLTG